MNTLRSPLIALTLFAALTGATGSAQADFPGRGGIAMHGGGGHGFGPGFHPHNHGGYGGGYRGGWAAPLLGAALVGGAIYATRPAPVVVQPPPVIYQQPAVITDPSRVSYYCQPYQQYYPHVTQCPSAWQIVPY